MGKNRTIFLLALLLCPLMFLPIHPSPAVAQTLKLFGGPAQIVSVAAAFDARMSPDPRAKLAFSDAGLSLLAQNPARPGPYINDGQRVSIYGKVLQGADPKTFTFISDVYSAYGKDAMHVYLQDKPIPGADPATFTLIGIHEYAKDSAHVFLGLIALQNADPDTFTVLEGGFAKDARQVYYESGIVAGADAQSFSIVAFNQGAKNLTVFAKDMEYVFYQGGWDQVAPSIIAGADPNTFVTLDHDDYEGGYAKDAHAVYWGDKPVQGADPKNFQSMAPYGRDQRAVFLEGKRIDGADPATFVVIEAPENGGLGYAKDAHAVYWESHQIPGADPATFVTVSDSDTVDSRDKNHNYLAGKLVK